MVMQVDRVINELFTGEFFAPGVEKLRPYLEAFSPHIKKLCIVAGTNGKGETVAALTQTLQSQGISVASWSSPHLQTVRERVLLNGEMFSEKLWLEQIEQLKGDVDKLSYYEFLFILFWRLIESSDSWPEVIILEVGLGGRLDAVNYFDADLVLIPSISRDHQEYLGQSYREILAEKLAVTRQSSHLITAFQVAISDL